MTTPSTNADETRASRMKFWGAAIILLMMVLMVFSTNIGSQFAQRGGGSNAVVGKASGDRTVTFADRQNAARMLEVLNRIYVNFPSGGGAPPRDPEPLAVACWGPELVREFGQKPEALALLIQEATANGPGASRSALGEALPEQRSAEALGLFNSGDVSLDHLRPIPSTYLEYLGQQFGNLYVSLSIATRTPLGVISGKPARELPPAEQGEIYSAFQQFLAIQSASALVLDSSKVSEPMVDRMIAQNRTAMTVQFASFDANAKFNTTTQPTDAQIETQLKAYADKRNGAVTRDNPFGFGYRIPDRVKLEMIGFKRADVRKLVEAEKTPYEWEVAARIAYARDRTPFLSRLPSTHPAYPASTQPAATQPAFDVLKAEAVQTEITRAVDARVADIEKRMRIRLSGDYQAWTTARASNATTQPTSLGVAYDSGEYLEKLAAEVNAQFKIQPTVYHYNKDDADWRDAAELGLLGAFSNAQWTMPLAVARTLQANSLDIPAPLYATEFARDLMSPRLLPQAGDSVLEHFEPSDLVTDPSGDGEVFIFRITAAQPNRPATPADLVGVRGLRDRVALDWRLAEAQRQTLAEANAAMQAVPNPSTDLQSPGLQVLAANVGPFGDQNLPVPPQLGMDERGYAQFAIGVNDLLLGEPGTTPVAVIDVPLAKKTLLVRRVKMWSTWTSEQQLDELRIAARRHMAERLVTVPTEASQAAGLPGNTAHSWLSPDRVLARNDYEPEKAD